MTSLPLEAAPSGRRDGLVLTPAEAVALIGSGDTIAVGGTGSLLQVPETLLAALEQRWLRERTPAGLDVVHVMGLGDHEGRGVDHISIAGLVRRFVSSHYMLSPRQQRLVADDEVEAVALPAGTISLLYREIGARRPGLFTDIGLDTFVDPRHGGGRLNQRTAGALSSVVEVDRREWLFYPAFDVDVALLRATEADPDGNVTMDDEAAVGDNLAIAQAAHNSGGLVVVEVKRLRGRGELAAGRVRIPGALVDHVVLTDYPRQTPITIEDARRTGRHPNAATTVEALPLDQRKVVARRAAQELCRGDVANLGVGMANGISYVALEEGFLDDFTLTVEQGVLGGLPGVGLDSGTAINPTSIIDMPSTFDLYDGGALDFAGLAYAQVDRHGNVNVASVGGVPIGPGGFIDISQKARCVVFCGTLRGGGLETDVDAGELRIRRDGRYRKFVDEVEHVSFCGARAHADGQQVLYVTERAVFRLGAAGLELVEIAPGVDVQTDVVDQMGFDPTVAEPLRVMDERLFRPEPVGMAVGPRRPVRTVEPRPMRPTGADLKERTA